MDTQLFDVIVSINGHERSRFCGLNRPAAESLVCDIAPQSYNYRIKITIASS